MQLRILGIYVYFESPFNRANCDDTLCKHVCKNYFQVFFKLLVQSNFHIKPRGLRDFCKHDSKTSTSTAREPPDLEGTIQNVQVLKVEPHAGGGQGCE